MASAIAMGDRRSSSTRRGDKSVIVTDNTVAFNDLRGSYNANGPRYLWFGNPGLEDLNTFAGNLGEDANRAPSDALVVPAPAR